MRTSFSKPPNPKRGDPRPEPLRRPPVSSRGPRVFRKPAQHFGGPGEPPPGFVTATTSKDEWKIYWALMRILDPERDPRQPPFFGGKDWAYQSSELGTFTRSLGSAVVDFLITLSYPFIVLRIQTPRYHILTDSRKQAYDALQLSQLSNKFLVVDIYSQDFLADESGAAAIVVVKEALGLIRRRNPLTSGTGYLTREGRAY